MSKENLEGRAEKTLRDTDTYRVPVAIDIVAQRLNLTMSAAPLGEKVSGMLVVMGERGAIGYNSPPRRPDHARQPHTVRASACLVAVEFRDNPEPGVGAASALWLTYLRNIQLLLGHEDLETTARYLHLSEQHLHQVANPIEELKLSSVDQSRLLYHSPRHP